MASNQTPKKPASSENYQKLKLYGLKSDPLQECPNPRNQKSKLYGLKLDPLQACLNPRNHNPKPTWPHIRPHIGSAKSQKSQNYNKCEVPRCEPKGLSDPTSPPLPQIRPLTTPYKHGPLPEFRNLNLHGRQLD